MPQEANLPLAALENVEAAALQFLAAVRQAGTGVLSSQLSSVTGQARGLSIADLCNNFIASKELARRSDRYLRLLRTEVASFATGREKRLASSVSVQEVETWLHGQGWSARTMKGRLLTLRSVFTWAINRGELAANPANGVDVPFDKEALAAPQIHSPDQVREVLESARKIDLNVMRCMAIRYFAGLRTTEATELAESEIHRDFIEVTASKSKTRRRRLVSIQPNLRAWLDLGGVLPLRQVANRLRSVTRALGVPWHANVMRHSFVSYHLAKFENAGKTALEAGHSEQILFNHYRELVSKEKALEFFTILPKSK